MIINIPLLILYGVLDVASPFKSVGEILVSPTAVIVYIAAAAVIAVTATVIIVLIKRRKKK
jgi:hypothetical protein